MQQCDPYVPIKNITKYPLRINSRNLSGGYVDLAVDEVFRVRKDVYAEIRNRYDGLILNMEYAPAPVVEDVKEFAATHIFRDQFVVLDNLGDKRAYFTKEDGSQTWVKREDWESESEAVDEVS